MHFKTVLIPLIFWFSLKQIMLILFILKHCCLYHCLVQRVISTSFKNSFAYTDTTHQSATQFETNKFLKTWTLIGASIALYPRDICVIKDSILLQSNIFTFVLNPFPNSLNHSIFSKSFQHSSPNTRIKQQLSKIWRISPCLT